MAITIYDIFYGCERHRRKFGLIPDIDGDANCNECDGLDTCPLGK